MIDERRIEEAAINKCGFISSEFCSGAHWAIEQILKGLWHDASEEPKENLVLVVYDMVVDNGTIHNLVDIMTYDRFKMELYRKKWCYVSDIVGMNDFRKLVIQERR